MTEKKPLRRANNEGSLRLRKDGRWEVRFTIPATDNSKPKYKSIYCDSKQEAVQVLRGQMVPYQNLGPNGSKSLKTKQWLTTWLTAKQPAIKKTTFIKYQYVVECQLIGLSRYPLYALTLADIQNYYNYMLENKVTTSGMYRIHKVLKQSLKDAVRKGVLLSNPASGIELPPCPKCEANVFTIEQQRQLVEASYNVPYGICVRLPLATGIRIGELLALQWKDVDLSRRMIHIRHTQSNISTERSTPKTPNSYRSIPLTTAATKDLKVWKSKQQPIDENDSVFAYANGKLPTAEKFRGVYRKLLSSCDLPHYTFHSLRHTFATRALEVGMDCKTLSVILGHSNVAFTMDVYTHCSDKQKQKAMKLMEYEPSKTRKNRYQNEYENSLKQLKKCPDILTKEQLRKVCHISKNTAKQLLDSGEIPCITIDKQTWRYKIKKQDVKKYLKERAKMLGK